MATYRTRTARDGTVSVQVQVRLAGHPPQGATFPSKREATKWAATIEAAMVEGRHFQGAKGAKRTLAEAVAKFRLEVLPLKRNGSMYGFTLDWWVANHGTRKVGEVSRGWLSDARAQLLAGKYQRSTPGSKRSLFGKQAAMLAEATGAVPAMDDTQGRAMHAQGMNLAGAMVNKFQRTPATANRYMAALSAVFSQVCGDWEWLSPNANPFTGLGKLPEGKANKGKAYADDARAKLLTEAAKDPQLHRLCRVALGTMARAGELVGLTWSHVELVPAKPIPHSDGAGGGGGGYEPAYGRLLFEDTKNGTSRVAWLFGDALEAMREQYDQGRGAGVYTDPVAAVAWANRPVFPGQWSHKRQAYGRYDYLPRLHAALARAGLAMKRPFHALRHTGATQAARMGANAHQLKAMGGWKSNAVDTYVHMAAQDTKELSQALAKRLEAK